MKETIHCSSELMDDYQKLLLADPGRKMKAEVFEGNIWFFSVSLSGRFFLTVQQDNAAAAWRRIDLSRSLETAAKGSFTFKTFDTSEAGNLFHIAAVITQNGKDTLYLSQVADPDHIRWQAVPPSPKGETHVTELYLSHNAKKDYLIADMLKKDSIFTERYFIDIHTLGWCSKPIALEIETDAPSCIGRSRKERVDGIYTLDRRKNHLIYTPSYNYYDAEIAPNPMTFRAPPATTAISVQSPDTSEVRYTNLFACNDRGLYFYPVDQQRQDASPILLKESDLFKDTEQLEAVTVGGQATVWGRNRDRKLFILTCRSTAIAQPAEWDDPMIIYPDIVYFHPLENPAGQVHSFFAVTAGNKLIFGEQSAQTTLWSFRSVDLPPENETDVLKRLVYRSRVTVETDGRSVAHATLHLQATDTGILYINGAARQVRPDRPIEITPNASGVIVIQETVHDDIESLGYTIWQTDRQQALTVNPGNEKLDKLLRLNTVEALKNARLPQSNEYLVPTRDEQKLRSIAGFLERIGKEKTKLSLDGRITPPSNDEYCPEGVYVLTITPDSITSCSGQDAVQALTRQNDAVDFWGNIGNFFRNLWNYIRKGFEYIRMAIDAAGKFILEIAGKVYRFALDCIGKVVSAVRTVFEAIGTFFQKVIDYLKFLFDLNDIKMMKKAVCNCMKLSKDGLVNVLSTADSEVLKLLGNLQKILEESGLLKPGHTLPALGTTAPSLSAQGNRYTAGFNVSDMFLLDHLLENLSNLASKFLRQPRPDQRKIDTLIAKLENGLLAEAGAVRQFVGRIVDILKHLSDHTLNEVAAELLNAVLALALDSTAIIAQAITGVIRSVVEILYELLDTTIYIPIVTDILRAFGVPSFSLLDVLGYGIALLLTPILKLAFGESEYKRLNIRQVAEARSLEELTGRLSRNDLDGAARYKSAYRIITCINSGFTFFSILLTSVELGIAKPDKAGSETNTENSATTGGGLTLLSTLNGGLALFITGMEIASSMAYTPFAEDTPRSKNLRIAEYTLLSCVLVGRALGVIDHFRSKKSPAPVGNDSNLLGGIGQVAIVLPSVALLILSLVKLNTTSPADMPKEDYDMFCLQEPGAVLEDFNNFVEVVTGYQEDPYSKAGFIALFAVLGAGVTGIRIARAVTVV